MEETVQFLSHLIISLRGWVLGKTMVIFIETTTINNINGGLKLVEIKLN